MPTFASTECERRWRWLYWGGGSVALLWTGLLWLAPWFLATGRALPALVLYRVFALVCHQLPERSFHYLQFPLPVCVRCTGIYAGFATGWWLAAWLPAMRRSWLVAAFLPLIFDGLVGVAGFGFSTSASRLFTGVLTGGALGWWLFSHHHLITNRS